MVGAPVIAVGLVARQGGAVRTRGRRKALRLPSSVMLAVTPSHLHALSYDFKNGGTVVVGEVARWERNGLRADVDHTPACKVLSITLGDGTRVEFDPNPVHAAKRAAETQRLLVVLHLSGNFEDAAFT